MSVALMFGSSGLIKEGTVSVFQPFFVVSSQTCIGVEALRCQHFILKQCGWSVSKASIIDPVASVLNVPKHTDQRFSLSSLQRH